jgi:hypothetical protein
VVSARQNRLRLWYQKENARIILRSQDPPQNKPKTSDNNGGDNDSDDSDDAPELPVEGRLDLAHRAWIDSNGELKIREAIQPYMVVSMVLFPRHKPTNQCNDSLLPKKR